MINAHLPLGKNNAVHSAKTLKLAMYTAQLPPAPSTCDWTGKVPSFPMFGNDTAGDCTFAAFGHMIQIWTANAGNLVTPTLDDVLGGYSKLTGYKPGDPSTDKGAVELDVLNFMRKTGIGGHKIRAFMACHSIDDIKHAISLFGGCYFGFALPLSAQNKSSWVVNDIQTVQTQPGSWGGHAVNGAAYDQNTVEVITWGEKLQVSVPFIQAYGEESYAIVTEDWIESDKVSPSGFNINQLMADLELV